MYSVMQEDMAYILGDTSIDWERFRSKRILITGGTGLIGSTLIRALLYANQMKSLDIHVTALVRSLERVKEIFTEEEISQSGLVFRVCDLNSSIQLDNDDPVDYIIHGASPTASGFFISHPVETIQAGINGTMNLLELAQKKNAEAFLFLSSMEVYGKVTTEDLLSEESLGYLNPLVVRNCYPETKRMCEAMVASYASEYGIRATSIRLAQTFGPGVAYDDKRVFAMMARNVMNGENITLLTRGESRHAYLYTAQAVSAILCVLLKGEAGKSYNAANPATYCSIFEMGQLVAEHFGQGNVQVVIAENADTSKYPDTSYLHLSISAIEKLGWKPYGDLVYMYDRMICSMRYEK